MGYADNLKKCSIASLLTDETNSSDPVENPWVRGKLELIKKSLETLLKLASRTFFEQSQMRVINAKALEVFKELSVLFRDHERLLKSVYSNQISKINTSATRLKLIIEEKKFFKTQLEYFKVSYIQSLEQCPGDAELLRSRTRLQNDSKIDSSSTEGSNAFLRKSRRLPKQSIETLEKWYRDNEDHPYLNDSTLAHLRETTRLRNSQIRNWVANKRRKEKEVGVSQEILKLIEGEEV